MTRHTQFSSAPVNLALAFVLSGLSVTCPPTFAGELSPIIPDRMVLKTVPAATGAVSMNDKDFVALIRLAEQLRDYNLSLSDYDEFDWAATDEFTFIRGYNYDPGWELIYDGPIERGFRALMRSSDLSLLGVFTLSGPEIPKPSKPRP